MRILKIELRNYRGVSHLAVDFAPEGVTIVEGPNEIGKSSIAEAIDRLIEDMDSTSKQRVLAVKPVDQDVGPEVVMDAKAGPYSFRYRKRFIRERVTELEVFQPRPEHHAGREAHERVQAILSETVDMALWKALRMQQGGVVGQPSLLDQTSLSAALDRSAGESPAGDEELTLFDLAHGEYLQFWTETGRRKQAVAEIERAIEAAKEEITRAEAGVREIEGDVDASIRLEGEVRRLVQLGAEQGSRLGEYEARVEALAMLELGVETVQARFDAAVLVATEARRAEKAREDAIVAIATSRAIQKRCDTAIREDGPQFEIAAARVSAAETSIADARLAQEAARTRAAGLQGHLSLLRDAADLVSLEARSNRVKGALEGLQSAAADAAIPVDTNLLESIREQHRLVELARARLQAGRPLVGVEAMTDLAGVLDGLEVTVAAGERFERRVDQAFSLIVPGVTSITVTVGAVGDPTSAETEAATNQLAGLYRKAGATDLADASLIGQGRNPASLANQLLSDPRFKRTGVRAYGLSSWDYDEYTGVADEIAEEIERQGGEATLVHLVALLPARYGVSPASVRAYAMGPRFEVSQGSVKLRTAAPPDTHLRRPWHATRALFRVGPYLTYRLVVSTDMLRGSGLPVPAAVASAFSLAPLQTIELDSPAGPIRMSWPSLNPHFTSVRVLMSAAGAEERDRIFLWSPRAGRLEFRHVRAASAEGLVGLARLLCEMGLPPDAPNALQLAADALGLAPPSWTAVQRRLIARGEDGLASLAGDFVDEGLILSSGADYVESKLGR
jgi:hypothetical protein